MTFVEGLIGACLRTNRLRKAKGISHHGSAMFRHEDHICAGGERAGFYHA